jgi:D-3-phosphoglycerate dehydrogenase
LHDAEALIWTTSDPARFPAQLPDEVTWVQLPSAGVEQWLGRDILDDRRVWTSAAGAYAATVAEHALALLLCAVRGLPHMLGRSSWDRAAAQPFVGTLSGATVGVIGAGGIGLALLPLLTGLGAQTVAVNRSGRPVPGAHRTLPAARLAEVWPAVDHVVLAAPATAETRHLVGEAQLAALKRTSWLVNVGRGPLVDTDALVRALRDGIIAGACLDVVDPEPLPEDHPLWSQPRALITPHVANPPALLRQSFARHAADNVRRRVAGTDLRSVIDLTAGY